MRCPSEDWDRYLDMTELPDECPVCGGEYLDEEGESLVPEEQQPYCTPECREEGEKWAKEDAEAEREELLYYENQELYHEGYLDGMEDDDE